MSFYHDTKDAALLAGVIYTDHFNTRAELQPNNGWVLVLTPKSAEVFKYPLWDIMAHAEIELSVFPRLYRRPEGHKRMEPVVTKQRQASSGEPGSAPSGGATRKVWEIADRIFADKGIDRAAIIEACVAEGINPATAATQFSKWKKTK